MKILLLLRHAKSSWDQEGLLDHDRPLNKRGQEDAPKIGELIKDKHLLPELIISSTALRAKTTAQLVAKKCHYSKEIKLSEEIYEGSAVTYLRALNTLTQQNQSIVLLVGHNPTMESLVETLTGQIEPFPTSALAQIQLDISSWQEISLNTKGQLITLWRPKELWKETID